MVLVDDFATYLYLPRLRDSEVLIAAIRDGLPLLITWTMETFGYAQSKDASGRYLGLVGGSGAAIRIEGGALVVKPDVAAEQLRKDAEAQRQAGAAGAGTSPADQEGNQGQPTGREQPGGDGTVGPTPPAVRSDLTFLALKRSNLKKSNTFQTVSLSPRASPPKLFSQPLGSLYLSPIKSTRE